MARRGVRIVFLCEDSEHKQFAYRAFRKLDYHRRELRHSASPPGRGAAEQWVRERYATEVKAHRRRVSYQRVGLVVVIDADRNTVQKRAQQLVDELAHADQPRRETDERIAHWIPRRHIETWVAFLRDHTVDEEMDCKSLVKSDDYRPAAESFVQMYREPAQRPAELLESLALALGETDRLKDERP